MKFVPNARLIWLVLAILAWFAAGTGARAFALSLEPIADEPAPLEEQVFLPYINRVGTDLSVSAVKIIQGTSASGNYIVNIAGRATEVRIFVGTGSGNDVAEVTGKMCGYDPEGIKKSCISPINPSITAPSSESDLDSTLNFMLPMSWVKPGYTYSVEITSNNLLDELDKTNNRFPAQATQPFDFVYAPPLNIVIVPIEYRPFSDTNVYVPELSDLTYLTQLPSRILPVAEINFEDRLFYTYTSSDTKYNLDNPYGYGWVQLLSELTSLHNMEDPAGTRHYYGLVNSYAAHQCGNGCITGIGYLGGQGAYRTAAGWSGWGSGTEAAAETLVHELGHNFGRGHVHCTGRESNPDLNYPYPGGGIGQYGLDPLSGLLYDPKQYADFMSYCEPSWTSDYTYWNIFQYRSMSAATLDLNSTTEVEAIYVSGTISPEGELNLRPVYRQMSGRLLQPGGSYRLALLDEQGSVLADYAFTPYEIPEAPGFSAFGFFVPDDEKLDGIRVQLGDRVLAEKRHQGATVSVDPQRKPTLVERPDRAGILRWAPAVSPAGPVVYMVRISRDGGKTWQVLTMDQAEPEISLPADLGEALDNVWVEIQASDGLQSTTQTFPVTEIP
jgi:hypothetical protein